MRTQVVGRFGLEGLGVLPYDVAAAGNAGAVISDTGAANEMDRLNAGKL